MAQGKKWTTRHGSLGYANKFIQNIRINNTIGVFTEYVNRWHFKSLNPLNAWTNKIKKFTEEKGTTNENDLLCPRTWSLNENLECRLPTSWWTVTHTHAQKKKNTNRTNVESNKEKFLILILQDVLSRKSTFNLEESAREKVSKPTSKENAWEALILRGFQFNVENKTSFATQWERSSYQGKDGIMWRKTN